MIFNAKDRPLNQTAAGVPDVSGGILNYFKPIVLIQVVTAVVRFQADTTLIRIWSQGMVQSFTGRQLALKPEGERAWLWNTIYTLPGVELAAGDQVEVPASPAPRNFRIMKKTGDADYGYLQYEAVENYTG